MSDNETTALEHFTWGAEGSADYIKQPVADVPTFNLAMLALQGFRHKVGNEVAAKGAAWRKTEEGKAASEEEYNEYIRKARAEMLDKILNGQLGVRASSGPRVTGVEALKRQVALEFLKAAIKAYNAKSGKNISVPTGEKVINYMGAEVTREQLIDRYLATNGAKVEAEVAKRQAAQEAAADVGEDLFA
jgi:hypothetical protein